MPAVIHTWASVNARKLVQRSHLPVFLADPAHPEFQVIPGQINEEFLSAGPACEYADPVINYYLYAFLLRGCLKCNAGVVLAVMQTP